MVPHYIDLRGISGAYNQSPDAQNFLTVSGSPDRPVIMQIADHATGTIGKLFPLQRIWARWGAGFGSPESM